MRNNDHEFLPSDIIEPRIPRALDLILYEAAHAGIRLFNQLREFAKFDYYTDRQSKKSVLYDFVRGEAMPLLDAEGFVIDSVGGKPNSFQVVLESNLKVHFKSVEDGGLPSTSKSKRDRDFRAANQRIGLVKEQTLISYDGQPSLMDLSHNRVVGTYQVNEAFDLIESVMIGLVGTKDWLFCTEIAEPSKADYDQLVGSVVARERLKELSVERKSASG